VPLFRVYVLVYRGLLLLGDQREIRGRRLSGLVKKGVNLGLPSMKRERVRKRKKKSVSSNNKHCKVASMQPGYKQKCLFFFPFYSPGYVFLIVILLLSFLWKSGVLIIKCFLPLVNSWT
jgi:hypothetical protein